MRTEFRLATLTVEEVERKKISFEKAFTNALAKIPWKGDIAFAFNLAWETLENYMLADYMLRKDGIPNPPLRRKSAFRVAFYLVFKKHRRVSEIKRFTGGLLSKRLYNILRQLEKVEKEEDVIEEEDPAVRLSLKYSHPLWLVKRLLELLPKGSVEQLLKSNGRKISWLRVNALRMDERKAERMLKKTGLRYLKDRDVPGLFRITDLKGPLSSIKAVSKGLLIPQDKGSLLVASSLEPKPFEVIVDACAAPGMKTAYIYEKTKGLCRIIAVDISLGRINELVENLKRFLGSYENIDVVVSDSARIRIARNVDKVLVDAPCSNSGAIARDPALRVTLRDYSTIREYVRLQRRILLGIVRNLKFSSLTYAVCSLLPEEGEETIMSALKEGLVELERPNIPGRSGYTKYPDISAKVKRLFPHIHMTTGFFIANLVRKH